MKKDAIKDLDGCSLCGERVRLELANVSSHLPLLVLSKLLALSISTIRLT